MTPAYDPKRHTKLDGARWSAQEASDQIVAILADLADARLAGGGWPLHPLDAESYPTPGPKWALYAGAAGVVIATEILRKTGYPAEDYRSLLPEFYRSFLRQPDTTVAEKGLQIGEIGILTPAILCGQGGGPFRDRAKDCMAELVHHPAYEITNGQTGMMHAALALFRATGEACWKQAYLKGAEALWAAFHRAENDVGWFWNQEIFGQNRRYFGACHGITGNLNAFLHGRDLLPPSLITDAIQRTALTLKINAVRAKGLANWHVSTPPKQGPLLVQWCHGAAGVVTAMSKAPRENTPAAKDVDLLLNEAASLVWHAGPLVKGPSICHGTAGNGYAFLAMYHRNGEEHWLEKARAFAAHAIRQCREHRTLYGQGRYSLMTGDAGLAVYLHHCIHPQEACLPGLDVFA